MTREGKISGGDISSGVTSRIFAHHARGLRGMRRINNARRAARGALA